MNLSIILHDYKKDGFLLPPEILVNGRWRYRLLPSKGIKGVKRIYAPHDADWPELRSIHSVFCVEPSDERFFKEYALVRKATIRPDIAADRLQPQLPGMDSYQGPGNHRDAVYKGIPECTLIRLLDRFLVPDFRALQQPEEVVLVEQFYDYVASYYNMIITPELSSTVWRRLFEAGYQPDNWPHGPPHRVLDYGVGTGYTTRLALGELFPKMKLEDLPFELYGADLSRKMMEICRQREQPLFRAVRRVYYQAPGGAGFDSQFFDLVLMCFVEDCFPQESATYEIPFREIHRILKPGGTLVFNMHKPSAETIQNTKETLVRVGFESLSIVDIKFNQGGQSRLIPLVKVTRGVTESAPCKRDSFTGLGTPSELPLVQASFSEF